MKKNTFFEKTAAPEPIHLMIEVISILDSICNLGFDHSLLFALFRIFALIPVLIASCSHGLLFTFVTIALGIVQNISCFLIDNHKSFVISTRKRF